MVVPHYSLFLGPIQAADHQEARLQGLSELYNVLPDPQLQYNVLLELLQ